MQRLTTTPFGQRPVTAGLMKLASQAQAPVSVPHLNKWELFRSLCTARLGIGVTDRDLTVMNALLSFYPDTNLSDNNTLIVFPSNAALSERAHGMAESTLRRHLAALVGAGLIQRHDSPNGKRYAARAGEGEITRAFGFDLRPLLVRAKEISLMAAEVAAAALTLKRLREDVILLKRDTLKLIAYGRDSAPDGPWEAFEVSMLGIHKQMRRKLSSDILRGLQVALESLLLKVHNILSETDNMGGSDVSNERHYQNSNKDSYESELTKDQGKAAGQGGSLSKPASNHGAKRAEPNIPLAVVLKACPDILPYAPDRPRHWHELVALAALVRGMMGISLDAWEEAQKTMGPEVAAVTVVGILQRVSEIRSPGGYLRALSRKAGAGGFSPGPMIMALLNVE